MEAEPQGGLGHSLQSATTPCSQRPRTDSVYIKGGAVAVPGATPFPTVADSSLTAGVPCVHVRRNPATCLIAEGHSVPCCDVIKISCL